MTLVDDPSRAKSHRRSFSDDLAPAASPISQRSLNLTIDPHHGDEDLHDSRHLDAHRTLRHDQRQYYQDLDRAHERPGNHVPRRTLPENPEQLAIRRDYKDYQNPTQDARTRDYSEAHDTQPGETHTGQQRPGTV